MTIALLLDPDSLRSLYIKAATVQIPALRSEQTLVSHFKHCADHLKDFLPKRRVAALPPLLSLQSTLYGWTIPGMPHYPTRRVRREARRALGVLFPEGAAARSALWYLFRALRPLYALQSLAAHVWLRALSLSLSLQRFLGVFVSALLRWLIVKIGKLA